MSALNDLRIELLRRITAISERLNRQADNIAALATSATNQSAQITAINAKTQRVNQTIALTANTPLDVTITWPTPWPDTAYGIYTQLTTGNAALGTIHATPKSGSKTVNDCVITVLATVTVASAGLDVLGVRT